MYYSLIGLLALLILVITNHDVLFTGSLRTDSPIQKIYRWFLFSIIAYYVTDILWGILYSQSLTSLLYADTVIYFFAMALGIVSWVQYASAYLEEHNAFSLALSRAAKAFFVYVAVLITANLFNPIVFWFDENGAYQTGILRHSILVIQILILLLTSFYVLRMREQTRESEKSKYLTIGLFGLIVGAVLMIQLFFPLLPLYSIGYMLGSCLLRTFVIENEKEEYRRELEEALHREKRQLEELNTTWDLAYKDALTGVRSKLAYSQMENKIDNDIAQGSAGPMGVVVFDLNGLKQVNDTYGHDVGDRYIVEACRLICVTFDHSPVFRIGGDEFVAILKGDDYENRDFLMARFNRQIERNLQEGDVVVSAGMAEYIPGRDNSFERVFKRADHRMYSRKDELKGMTITESA